MKPENPNARAVKTARRPTQYLKVTAESERMISSLTMYMCTLIGQVRLNLPDLTNRQMALLLIIYMIDEQHTVRGLARHLEIAKPVVSRALDKLEALAYVSRRRGVQDRRDVFFDRTAEGAAFLDGFASRIVSAR